jgi:rhamnulokinase
VTTVVAVDFGASSIRVCAVDLDRQPPSVSVIHRHPHAPVHDGAGHLRWDWPRLVAEMHVGLDAALGCDAVASIGVDTWGVDYGLVDRRGDLVAPPFSYRDGRTEGWRATVDKLGEAYLYGATGIQLQPYNTLFQLAAHDPVELGAARHVLLLPDLLVYDLTGEMVAERTAAGTTSLVGIATGEWSVEIADAIGLDPTMLPTIVPATTRVGTWRGIPIHLVGGHDTASAVVAMGTSPTPAAAFASAGTWLLVGQERTQPDLSEWARNRNFSNEAGACGGFRLLKNVAGYWMIEQCRSAWGNPPVAALLADAAAVLPGPVVDLTDPEFLQPDDMVGRLTRAAGLGPDAPPAQVARCVVDSMAAAAAEVVSHLGGVGELYVLGGGTRDVAFLRSLSARTGLAVHRGPTEATALGNGLVQGIALGVYADLADARKRLLVDE